MFQFNIKKIFHSVLCLFTALVLTACSFTQSSEQTGNIKLNIAYMPNYASLHDIIAGIHSGIFKEEGLDIDLVEFSDGPTIIAALESTTIDIGNIGPGAHKLLIENRAEVISFAQLGNADEIIGRKDKGVHSLSDLKGKKIASTSGTSSETILNLALAEVGLTQNDVEIIDMDASSVVTAMISGSIDAVATWSPNTTAIKAELGNTVVSLANNVRYAKENPSIASYAVTAGYSKKNAEKVNKFLRGLYRAMDYRSKNENEVAEWSARQIGADITTIKSQLFDGQWLTSAQMRDLIESGEMELYYKKQQENFIKSKVVNKTRDVSEYVLFDQMKEALESIQ